MILERHILGQESIFSITAEALVNPCNCVGIAGAGLSLQFKMRFPEAHGKYIRACKSGTLFPGNILPVQDGERWIIHFPTKDHWRRPARLDYIEWGLFKLGSWAGLKTLKSISIPQLGCGLGGLNWIDVRPKILSALESFDGVVNLFE